MASKKYNKQIDLLRAMIARPNMYLFSSNLDCATSFVSGVSCVCDEDVLENFYDWLSVKYLNNDPSFQHWINAIREVADKKFKNDEEKTLFFIQNLDEYLSQYY